MKRKKLMYPISASVPLKTRDRILSLTQKWNAVSFKKFRRPFRPSYLIQLILDAELTKLERYSERAILEILKRRVYVEHKAVA